MNRVEDYIETAEIKATTLYSGIGQSYRFHDIQDLTQELLIVAWLAIGTYDPAKEASLKTWVNRKMDYFIQDFVRDEKNRKIHIEYVGDLWDLYQFVEEYQAARSLVVNEDMEEIYELLNPKQQDILRLKLEGYTHEEIAEKLGYSDNSGVAHQWKLIAKEIMGLKMRSNRNGNGQPTHKPLEDKDEEELADYFKQFWDNLPQNRGESTPETPDFE